MSQINRQNTFNQALPIIAQLLADKIGVRIEFSPGTPCTDGKCIQIPKVRTKDRKEEIDVLSSLIHEAGHVRFTNFQAQPGSSELERVLANSLEDPRIEKLMSRHYYGAISYFERAFKESIESDLLAVVDKTDACDLLCLYVMTRAHGVLLGHTYTEKVYDAVRERMLREVGSSLVAKLDAMLDRRFPKCRNTNQIIELARDIAVLVCNHQPQAQQQEQSNLISAPGSNQSGSNSSQSESAEATSASETNRQPESEFAKARAFSKKNQETSSDNGSPKEAGKTRFQSGYRGGASQQGSGTNSCNQGQHSAAQDEWNAARNNRRAVKCSWDSGERFIKVCSQPVPSSKGDGSGTSSITYNVFTLDSLKRRKPNSSNPSDTAYARVLLERGLQQTCGLRRALQKLIVERERRCERLMCSGTRIRSGALARLGVGNTKVFGRMTEVRGVSTAVHVLLDGSGSMGGGKFDLAIQSSLAIVHSLQSVKSVSVGLTLFQDYDASVLIRHGETINQNLGRIGLCDFIGGTPLYTALLAGAYQLAQRTETRKVLIVLSDLREREINSCSRQVIKDLTKAGIIVVGITIGDSKAAEAFPYATNILDLADLGPALFEATSKIFK